MLTGLNSSASHNFFHAIALPVSRARARLRDVACYLSTHWFVPLGVHFFRNRCSLSLWYPAFCLIPMSLPRRRGRLRSITIIADAEEQRNSKRSGYPLVFR